MPGADRGDTGSSIVVTGLGAVTAFGWGTTLLWEGLRRGEAAFAPATRFDPSNHRTRLTAEVPLGARPALPRRASWADRFAIAAAEEAWRQSGRNRGTAGGSVGVYFGTSTGGMLEGERYYAASLRGGARSARPGLLASQQLNGPGDAVARALSASGPVETVASACASGAMAIAAALRALRRGEVDTALAGGSDALCELTYGGFNALRSVDERPCRPFRKDRLGLSLGEGAAVLVLERADAARASGARAIAVLAGAGESCDAHHMTAPHVEGRGASDAILRALEDARLTPAEIDFVNAHGTGTPHNDAAEAKAMHRVFGDRVGALPVTSTKALIGHLLGSSGAVEAVATVLGLARREVHPMPRAGEPDEALALDLVLGRPRPLSRAVAALSLSFAFGGANAALAFRAPEAW